MPSLWIRLLSDIHLEHRSTSYFVEPFLDLDSTDLGQDQTCCILAGDIGHPMTASYERFLAEVKAKFDHVLVVTGNHEYYKQDGRCWNRDQIDRQVELVCQATGCVFLQRRSYTIGPYRFLGCTLWGSVPPEARSTVDSKLKDLRQIKIGRQLLTVDQYNQLHRDDVAWLQMELDRSPLEPTLIVTHHAPSIRMLSPNYRNDPMSCCYATDLESMMTSNPLVVAWFSGHCHYSIVQKIGPTLCASNAVGYDSDTFNRFLPLLQLRLDL